MLGRSLVSRFSPHAVGTISKASYPLSKPTPSLHRSLEVKVSGDTAQVEITPVKAYKCDAPATWVDTSKQEVIQALRDMMLMRRMEIAADLMYKSQLIKGFCHLYDGQEAIAIGMEMGCTKKDAIVTSYRDHCWQLSRGDNAKRILAELTGRSGGCTKGKGGSMHMYLSAANFYGGNGIVGAQVPLGAGMALAAKYKTNNGLARGSAGSDAVAFTLYGDGAANQGQVFEAVNMAYLWKLPCVFVIENNQYAMGTSLARGASNAEFYTRYDPLPGLKVDGMDCFSVKACTQYARKWCMEGQGPFVLEMNTYRYHGHSMSDPGLTYRSRDEVSSVRKERDPIDKLKRVTLQLGYLDEGGIKDLEKAVRAEVDEAVEFAKTSPDPALPSLYTEVFTEPLPYIRGTDGTFGQGKCSWAPAPA